MSVFWIAFQFKENEGERYFWMDGRGCIITCITGVVTCDVREASVLTKVEEWEPPASISFDVIHCNSSFMRLK